MEHRTLKIGNMKREIGVDGKKYLSGYFARYNEPYEVCSGWVETISPGAFDRCLDSGEEVKALWNHNHDIVLGSTGAGTLTLRKDTEGLPGSIEINEEDTDAMNAYARVGRGDVSGCSFGFDCVWDDFIDSEGVYRTVIREITRLYEVSPCTFPAYESTSIQARDRLDERKASVILREKTAAEHWRERMKGVLRNGAQDHDAEKKA